MHTFMFYHQNKEQNCNVKVVLKTREDVAELK